MYIKTSILFCLLIAFFAHTIQAQTTVDYTPQYQAYSNEYQIDKIVHTAKHTIIHFRFARENSVYHEPTFYPPKSEYAWVLETNNQKVFPLKTIKNIQVNGQLTVKELGDAPKTIAINKKIKTSKVIFSCEIYFDRIPSAVDTISLVEGEGFKLKRSHLNCIDIILNNKEKGTEYDLRKRLKKYKQLVQNPGQIYQPYKGKNIHTDRHPEYKIWQYSYILEKIVYTSNETIFHFKFETTKDKYTDAIFYPPNHEMSWFLRDCQTKKEYPLKAITRVKRNGRVVLSTVSEEKTIESLYKRTTYTCRIHFEKLPETVKEVDLIEGKGEEKNPRHFNCFKIKLNR